MTLNNFPSLGMVLGIMILLYIKTNQTPNAIFFEQQIKP